MCTILCVSERMECISDNLIISVYVVSILHDLLRDFLSVILLLDHVFHMPQHVIV